jgi:hypothetical protein
LGDWSRACEAFPGVRGAVLRHRSHPCWPDRDRYHRRCPTARRASASAIGRGIPPSYSAIAARSSNSSRSSSLRSPRLSMLALCQLPLGAVNTASAPAIDHRVRSIAQSVARRMSHAGSHRVAGGRGTRIPIVRSPLLFIPTPPASGLPDSLRFSLCTPSFICRCNF